MSPIELTQGPVCPIPLSHNQQIMIGHGSGGRMTHDLIKNYFAKEFANDFLLQSNDAASINDLPQQGKLAITTDSHIVKPLFFPGGDIGRLAIAGTVNDLLMIGAIPKYLTAGFILEEGMSIDLLNKVISSMAQTAKEAGVFIIAGDTKVVEKGKADGIFINTAGIGYIPKGRNIGGQNAQPGDVILITGTLGNHGIAVLSARGELGLETNITSDVAPLNHLLIPLFEEFPHIHVLRDPTRGGLATTLNEIALQSNIGMELSEESIPIHPAVQTACDMLGFDPLYIANEGKAVIILPEEFAERALLFLRKHMLGEMAMRIGVVTASHPGKVLLNTSIGGSRILDMLTGELLPRIC